MRNYFCACLALNGVLKENKKKDLIENHRKKVKKLRNCIKEKGNQLKSVLTLCKEAQAKYVAIQGTPEGFAQINEILEKDKVPSSSFYSNKSKKVEKKKTSSTLPPVNNMGHTLTPSACYAIFNAYNTRVITEQIFQCKTTTREEEAKLTAMMEELRTLKDLDEDTLALADEHLEEDFQILGEGVQKHKVHGGHKCPRIFKQHQEEELANIIRFCDRRGFQLTVHDFAYLAYQYGADLPEKERPQYCRDPHRCRMGRKWIKGFMERNPDIIEKMPQNLSISRALSATQMNLRNWFSQTREMFESTGLLDRPQNIWNVDEIGICDLQKMVKTLCVSREGAYQVTGAERGKLTTVLALCNAAGVVVPPMVIFKGERVQAQWLDFAPKNMPIRATKSGYINANIFFEYMKMFVHFLNATGKLQEGNVLLLDCHYSHVFNLQFMDLMVANNIRVWSLHPHTTHAVQPLDSHPFKALKKEINNGLRNHNRSHMGKMITKEGFFQVFVPAWKKAMNISTIQGGFRDCGICPFNPQAVNWKRLFPDGSESPEHLAAKRTSETFVKKPVLDIRLHLHVYSSFFRFIDNSIEKSEQKGIGTTGPFLQRFLLLLTPPHPTHPLVPLDQSHVSRTLIFFRTGQAACGGPSRQCQGSWR